MGAGGMGVSSATPTAPGRGKCGCRRAIASSGTARESDRSDLNGEIVNSKKNYNGRGYDI